MKSKLVLAAVLTAFTGFAGLSTANAGVDVDINIGLPRPPTVIIGGGHHHRDHHDRFDRRDRGYYHRAPRGYWKEITEKVYVPGRRIVRIDRHGHEVHVRERGHYVYRTKKVWVEGRRYAHR